MVLKHVSSPIDFILTIHVLKYIAELEPIVVDVYLVCSSRCEEELNAGSLMYIVIIYSLAVLEP